MNVQNDVAMSYELKEFLFEELDDIDRMLAQQAIDPTMRPLEAAAYFVKEFVLEVEGGKKENYFEHGSFAEIYRLTKEWYLNRYGETLKHYNPMSLNGVVMLFETPFQLSIPLTLSEVEVPGESVWVCFPITIHPKEDVLSWLIKPPNLKNLSADECRLLEAMIREVAIKTRSLHNDLMTADFSSNEVKKLAESVLAHISKSVEDICSLVDARLSIAAWEVYFAVEKTIKLFLYQKAGKAKHIHPLENLAQEAEQHGLPPLDRQLLSALPDTKDAMRHRYNELMPPTPNAAVSMYLNALEIALHCARSLERKIVYNNVRFLMKMPPWLKQ